MLLLFLSIFVSSNGLSMSGNFGIFTLSKILNQSVLGSWVSMKLQTKMLHVWWKVENLTPLPFDWLPGTLAARYIGCQIHSLADTGRS